MQPESFPRQNARTHRFGSGAPRLFTLSPDGDRVVFVRSTSGQDPVGRLWLLDAATGTETLLADPLALHDGAEELSDQERARRERMREGGAGVVGYATDSRVRRAAFALSGELYAVDLEPGAVTRPLQVPGPVLDPRPSPDGTAIAYVAGRALRVCAYDGWADRLLAEPEHELATCGLADFIGAEELGRSRGFWWSPESDALLVAHVDETPVAQWWIADPVHPDRPPVAHRYPAAGSANASVTLELVRLDGARLPVTWDRDAFPYLADVSWTAYGDALIVVLSRDQRNQCILRLDTTDGSTRLEAEVRDPQWVEATPGATRWSPDGRLLTLRADHESDTYRLHLGQDWLSPAGLNVRDVIDVDEAGVVVTTAPEPVSCALQRITWDGAPTLLSSPSGWSLGRSAGGTDLVAARSLATTTAIVTVHHETGTHSVVSFAESPHVAPGLTLLDVDGVRVAVLLPTGHVAGSRRLPILLSPYGGPHAQRVVRALGTYGEQQWLADQGFCVVVADGRGTPGRGPAWDRACYRDLAGPALADQLAALDAVVARWPADVDPSRVGIRGWSFGGYLAALAVLRRPDRVHAAVAGAPVTDWRLYDTAYTERYLGDPVDDAEVYDTNSLLPLATDLARPLLIMHGLTDDNVVVAHTLALSGRLTAAGRPHSVLPLSGVTHMTPQEDVAENKLLLELDFLRTALQR